ncbi:hypothetical protein [Streptomyces sp. NPDC012888]|uniref:hypothetical protein n=1 Tax=Streptomyces sp. NPDC012888 TaxID=3364855 RepID=UPI003678EE3A
MTEVSVDRLRAVFDLLLDHVAPSPAASITVEREAFWSIPADAAYDVYGEPGDLTIGMVSESWAQLERMVEDPERVVGHGFVWLAEVLRAIGDGSSG